MSKLRENNRTVIGVGVKKSTSDLLIANCDEFIFYDDLVRSARQTAKPQPKAPPKKKPAAKKDEQPLPGGPQEAGGVEPRGRDLQGPPQGAGEGGNIWGSMIKQTIKRRNPGFDESYHGFSSFGQLLEEAEARGILELERDEKSGATSSRAAASSGPGAWGRTPPRGEAPRGSRRW